MRSTSTNSAGGFVTGYYNAGSIGTEAPVLVAFDGTRTLIIHPPGQPIRTVAF
jgi:hypothetical protein